MLVVVLRTELPRNFYLNVLVCKEIIPLDCSYTHIKELFYDTFHNSYKYCKNFYQFRFLRLN